MTFRRVLLIAMLVVLGLCAAAGVLAVFTASGEHMWRVLGTAIDTAVATGLLLPLSALVSREKVKAGAITGMVVILGAWACVLAAIWDIGGGSTEKPALSAVFILFMGIPTAAALMMLSLRPMRVAVWTFVGGAVTGWLLCEGYLFTQNGWRDESLLSTGMVVYGVSTVAAGLLVNLGCGDRRYFRWAGILAAAVGLAIAVVNIWKVGNYGDEFYSRLACAVIVPAIVMAHINLVLMARLRGWQWPFVWGICFFSVLAGVLADVVLMRHDWAEPGNLWARGSAAAGIVAACGSLALVVVAVLNRKMEAEARTPGALTETALELTCPRCKRKQTVAFGDSACVQCELQFSIKVVEPRCPACGYLLFRMTGTRCPECGVEVGGQGAGADIASS